MTDLITRLEALAAEQKHDRPSTAALAAEAAAEIVKARDVLEDVREELAVAWPEDREGVLAADPVLCIAKLIMEREEEIGAAEQFRSEAMRLRALLAKLEGAG